MKRPLKCSISAALENRSPSTNPLGLHVGLGRLDELAGEGPSATARQQAASGRLTAGAAVSCTVGDDTDVGVSFLFGFPFWF